MRRALPIFLYLVFVAGLSWVSFLHPVSGDFDRYIYEALIRGRQQNVYEIYPIVKHENPRAEVSTVLDSPEHLAQLEPLYAIRPIYLEVIESVVRGGVPIQRAISMVSALSLFGIGIVLLGWTHRPAYCALLMAAPSIVVLGRIGTPDALSSLLVLSAAWALVRQRLFAGVLLLLASVWSRTDNILVVLLILAWLAGTGKLSPLQSAILAVVAAASVLVINHFSGNYGWRVLFHFSFIGGKYPAEIAPDVSWREYIVTVGRGLKEIGGQELALWTLIGIAAWRWLPKSSVARQLLLPIAFAVLARFLLFPTPEDRYFSWAYLVVGACFVEAIGNSPYFHRAHRVPDNSR